MTTRWRPDFNPDHLYFVTTKAANYAPIFRRDIIKRLIVDALYFVSLMNSVDLYAFVVMLNHIHLIIQCPPEFPPKNWIRVFKTGVTQLVVRWYQVEGNQLALEALTKIVERTDKQTHKVWEDGYLAKNVVSAPFLAQKLAYIHNNPVQSHWQLVDAPENYFWSSARYYLQGEPAIIRVKDARELMI